MDDATADHLRRYSRGKTTSRLVRDATGLDYALVLGRLLETIGFVFHGVRLPDRAAIDNAPIGAGRGRR